MFAGQSGPPRYRVQRGDTLAQVAERYGVSVETLARLNHLRSSARLHAGGTITVPETPSVTVAAAATPVPAAPAASGTARTPTITNRARIARRRSVRRTWRRRESAEDAAARAAAAKSRPPRRSATQCRRAARR